MTKKDNCNSKSKSSKSTERQSNQDLPIRKRSTEVFKDNKSSHQITQHFDTPPEPKKRGKD